jgi:hypothetical protein
MKRMLLLSVAVSCLFKLNAMQDVMPKYLVGIKIPNTTYADKEVNPVYMTIAYVGHLDTEKSKKIVAALNVINKLRPIELEVKEAGWLGADLYQFYARKLVIKNQKVLKSLVQLYYDYGECEIGMPEKYVIPNWHIPFKNSPLHREFYLKENTTIIGGALFIKQVGKEACVFELN